MESGIENMNSGAIFNLETKLAAILKPVKPNPVFVDALKLKLSQTPAIVLESSRKNLGLLFLGLGLFTGALTLWIIRRFKPLK
jgi:hypothetical protein